MKNIYIAMVMLGLVILSLGSVSALEFDNVKSYDSVIREVTIKNTFGLGADIGKARLNTPINYKVAPGYQKVAEFDLWAYQDYADILKSIEFYDKNQKDWEKAKFEREFDFKYKTYENVLIDDFKTECSIDEKSLNKTQTCQEVKVGSHYEEREVWKKINPATLKKNEVVTIGIFTEVKIGDYVEWIPQIYGVKVIEWATWTADLNVGLISYYKLDETTGTTAREFVNGNNATISNGITIGREGKINYGIKGDNSVNAQINSPHQTYLNLLSNTAMSWSFWRKGTTTTLEDILLKGDGGNASRNYFIRFWNGKIYFSFHDGTNYRDYVSTDVVVTNNIWQHYVMTKDSSNNLKLYVNGISVQNWTITQPLVTNSLSLKICGNNNGYTCISDFDEMGIWNRVLTQAEITQLYNGGTGITYISSFDKAPNITLNSPSSANYTISPQNIQMNFTASDDINLSDVKLYVNGVLNQTNASGLNNSIYLFDLTLGDGNYSIYGKATDNKSQETSSATILIKIDSTPFIEFLTPPTLENYANITQEFIPMKVNVSTSQFKNITYLLENINGTIYTQFYENETYDINFTDMPDAHYHYNVTICTTTDKCNSTETRHINHDTTPPTLELFSPLTNFTTLTLPINVTLNFTTQDEHLSSCWYNYNGTNTTLTCNTTQTINVTTSGAHSIDYYSNDTFGNLASGTAPFYVYYITRNATATNPITEGGISSHSFYLNMTDITNFNATAELYWNGTSQGLGTKTTLSNNALRFDKNIVVPSINGTSVNWTWVYNISGNPNVTDYNLTGSQTYIKVNISECGAGTYQILNYTLYDQDTRALGSTANASIEVDLTLTSQANDSLSWQYHSTKSSATSFLICLPSGALNNSAYDLDSVSKYTYQDHVVQYHYIESFNLTNDSIPQTIRLYPLSTAKSTSFLVNYQDENYIYVENAVIDVWRRYVGDGVFFSVEHGKTDASGQTRLHLVTEDIIYKFLVWQDGELVYTSPEYLALCQATPCQINLRQTTDESEGLSERDNLLYDYDFNETTRTATFTFATKDNTQTEINMTILSSNQYANETACTSSITTSGGQIDCIIPPAFANTSYQTIIYQDGEFFGTAFDSLAPKSMDIFGYTGLILTAIAYLLLALMGISSGIATIVFGIIGLVFMGIIQIFESGNVFGMASAIIWLIVAGVIIIIKITKRRIQ